MCLGKALPFTDFVVIFFAEKQFRSQTKLGEFFFVFLRKVFGIAQ
jgi:hypothetical protein